MLEIDIAIELTRRLELVVVGTAEMLGFVTGTTELLSLQLPVRGRTRPISGKVR